jgi:hypothetical protein
LSRIVVRVTQQRDAYQEYVFAGTCLSIRCLAVGQFVTILIHRNAPPSRNTEGNSRTLLGRIRVRVHSTAWWKAVRATYLLVQSAFVNICEQM